MGDVAFEAQAVTLRYPGTTEPSLHGVTLTVETGELVGVVGPNGSGKTTLIRVLLGGLRPTAGRALAFGRPVGAWTARELAQRVGVVAQREEPAFPLRVRQAVLFGRYPHLSPVAAPRPRDWEIIDSALERCDVAHLRDRWVATLSGGEWQRVRIARALAQEPRALVLDEATANLDIKHEMEVFELVRGLIHQHGLGGLLVTHHVNLAARFVDRVVVMDRGRAQAVGPPGSVLTQELLARVFEWPVAVGEWHGAPQFVPLRLGEADE